MALSACRERTTPSDLAELGVCISAFFRPFGPSRAHQNVAAASCRQGMPPRPSLESRERARPKRTVISLAPTCNDTPLPKDSCICRKSPSNRNWSTPLPPCRRSRFANSFFWPPPAERRETKILSQLRARPIANPGLTPSQTRTWPASQGGIVHESCRPSEPARPRTRAPAQCSGTLRVPLQEKA